ncbi:MAG: hypothetical protein H0U74_22915 [Bradymonadaceae bacterium]|nr:hypothetical protein [Lujinxingiaceae bacterium]
MSTGPQKLALCLLFALFLGGCPGACSGKAAPNDANRLSPAPSELTARWAEATLKRKVAPSSPTRSHTGLRYEANAHCPLTYDFEATTSFTSAARPGRLSRPQIKQTLGRFDLLADAIEPTQWRLNNRALGQYTVRNQVRQPGKEFWPGELADAIVENQRLALVELGEPGQLWSRLGTFSGLQVFFPALPDAAALDAMTHWDLRFAPLHDSQGQARTPRAFDPRVEVHLVEWIEIDGHEAAVLDARYAFDETYDGAASESIVFFGRYVVLRSGRLLHAALSLRRALLPPPDEHEAVPIEVAQLAEARLSAACDGPVLDAIPHHASRTKLALDTYTKLVFALNAGNPERAAGYLATDLIATHGADQIVALLQRHVAHHGQAVLGDPGFFEPVEIDGQFLRFRIVGRAENFPDASHSAVTVINQVTIEEIDGAMSILAIGSTSIQNSEQWNVLEISARNLYSPAQPQ